MSIKAADVAKLRKITGAGMMDCKKALTESNGDFDGAVKIIREKGKAIANKRADRDATEGAAIAKYSRNRAGLVVLNCETDFVAKNEDFIELTTRILDAGMNNSANSIDELKKLILDDVTIEEKVNESMAAIGEKLDLSAFDVVEGEKVVAYTHPGNRVASIVAFSKEIGDDTAKDIAMQVAAMSPVSIDESDVPQDVIDRELEIGRNQALQEGKPENMVDKIAQGKLNKFFKESTLMNQAFIKENKQTIKQYLASVDKDVKVVAFKRVSLGD